MTLYELIKMFHLGEDTFPSMTEVHKKDGTIRYEMDSRSNSILQLCICFMCEEETWVTVNIRSEILIPWYECEVLSISPGDEYTLEVWLKNEEYYLDKGYDKYLDCRKEHEE